jgi:hypothetical protein
METCPLLEKCAKIGMKCEERKFADCDFYNQLLSEKEALRLKKLVESYSLPEKIEAQREYYRKKYREHWRTKREEEKRIELEALKNER